MQTGKDDFMIVKMPPKFFKCQLGGESAMQVEHQTLEIKLIRRHPVR